MSSKYRQVSILGYRVSSRGLKTYSQMPGPRNLPVIGSMWALKSFGMGGDLEMIPYDQFLISLNKKYGDLVKFQLMNIKSVYTFKTEHARAIFQAESSTPNRPALLPWIMFFKKKKYPFGLLTSQDDEWKKRRQAINPLLARPQAVAKYLPLYNEIMNEYVEYLTRNHANQSSFEIHKLESDLNIIFLEMITGVVFNKRLNCFKDVESYERMRRFVESIERFGEHTSNLIYSVPVWALYPTDEWRKFESLATEIYDFIWKFVLDAHKELGQEATESSSLLHTLSSNKNLSLNEAVSVISDLILGAFDLTSATIHYLFYEVGRNAQLQQEIYDEVSQAHPEGDGLIDESALGKLPLLKATVKEVHRFHPLISNHTRLLHQDLVLDEFVIPKGAMVNMCVSVMSKSSHYFTDPHLFKPKRWLRGRDGSKTGPELDHFASMPFGHGVRMCIGRRLAEQKVYVILMKLLKSYRIEYTGATLQTKHRLIIVPNTDLRVKLIKR